MYDTVLHMQQMSTVNNESSSRRKGPGKHASHWCRLLQHRL